MLSFVFAGANFLTYGTTERVARELQVADVDRIEAPTKDPDGIHAAHAHSRGRRKSV